MPIIVTHIDFYDQQSKDVCFIYDKEQHQIFTFLEPENVWHFSTINDFNQTFIRLFLPQTDYLWVIYQGKTMTTDLSLNCEHWLLFFYVLTETIWRPQRKLWEPQKCIYHLFCEEGDGNVQENHAFCDTKHYHIESKFVVRVVRRDKTYKQHLSSYLLLPLGVTRVQFFQLQGKSTSDIYSCA